MPYDPSKSVWENVLSFVAPESEDVLDLSKKDNPDESPGMANRAAKSLRNRRAEIEKKLKEME